MSKSKKHMAQLLSFTRALAAMYQHMHWKTSGPTYYGDHLLYERLYGNVDSEIDGIAEKTIGLFDDDKAINPVEDLETTSDFVSSITSSDASPEEFPKLAIAAEKKFAEAITMTLEALREDGMPMDGVENMLQGVVDLHESHLYLLQQRTRTASIVARLVVLADSLDTQGLHKEASELDEICRFVVAKAEKEKRPPKKWWDKMEKEIKKNSPDYSEERVAKTIGDIWFNNLTEKKRKEIAKRDRKPEKKDKKGK